MKISVVVTVLNEEKNILALLEALANQSKKPDEIVIVDGGSQDKTLRLIKSFKNKTKLSFRLINTKSNRSQGRNKGIAEAKYDWIALTDAGCIPHPTWIAQLIKHIDDKQTRKVVAGFYDSMAKTSFEKAMVPYALVMPDQANPKNFLPATRSMLLHRSIWQELGGFNEKLEVSEDYQFAKLILKAKPAIRILFAPNAKVSWQPRKNLKSFISMVYQMARDDVRGHVLRIKALFVIFRYLFASLLLGLLLFFNISWALAYLVIGFLFYSLWAIKKNKRYVGKSWFWLPILQYSADLAVIIGTLIGILTLPFRRSRVK